MFWRRHGWKGHDGDIAAHGLPFTPGHELSGVVSEVGPGVERFAVGDRVAAPFILSCGSCCECARGRATVCEWQEQPGFTAHGGFAQFVALPRADRNLCPLPEAVPFTLAAALGCRTTTAFRAVAQQGQLRRGEALAVFGCGGVGLSCVMVGVAAGAAVVAVDVSPEARAKALEMGATAAVDGALPLEALRAAVLDAVDAAAAAAAAAVAVTAATVTAVTADTTAKCSGAEATADTTAKCSGADVTVDAGGFQATCEAAVWCARRGGRMVQVGLPLGGGATGSPRVPMARVAAWELELVGSHGADARDFPTLLAKVASGEWDVGRLVGAEVSLSQGAKAIEAMDHGSPLGITVVTDFEH